MAPKRLALCAAAALAGSISGCGQTHVVGTHRTVYLALTEYRVSPQRIQSSPGQLTIFVENDGRLTHNLAVRNGSHTTGTTQPIAPGHRRRLVLDLRKGTYTVGSTMLTDQDFGLYGTLVVK